MTIVSGKNTVNRPYFFRDVNGQRVEIPSFGVGQGDLEGSELATFKMYEAAGQIRSAEAKTKPVNVSAPAVTGGTDVGSTLTSTNGTWSGIPTPTFTRSWQLSTNGTSGWADIAGETDETYVVEENDEQKFIRCSVTATNENGKKTANSNVIGPVTIPVGGTT